MSATEQEVDPRVRILEAELASERAALALANARLDELNPLFLNATTKLGTLSAHIGVDSSLDVIPFIAATLKKADEIRALRRNQKA